MNLHMSFQSRHFLTTQSWCAAHFAHSLRVLSADTICRCFMAQFPDLKISSKIFAQLKILCVFSNNVFIDEIRSSDIIINHHFRTFIINSEWSKFLRRIAKQHKLQICHFSAKNFCQKISDTPGFRCFRNLCNTEDSSCYAVCIYFIYNSDDEK